MQGRPKSKNIKPENELTKAIRELNRKERRANPISREEWNHVLIALVDQLITAYNLGFEINLDAVGNMIINRAEDEKDGFSIDSEDNREQMVDLAKTVLNVYLPSIADDPDLDTRHYENLSMAANKLVDDYKMTVDELND